MNKRAYRWIAAIATAVAATARAADWPQFGGDPAHSGNNAAEWQIGASNVATLHLAYRVALPAAAGGAPVLLAGATTPSGTTDVLFLTTEDGRLLAVDAASGAVLGAQQAVTGPRSTTSSPAIDPDRAHVYSYGLDGKVHKYTISQIVRNASAEVVGGGWPETATLKPDIEKGSSALAFATAKNGATFLYAAQGGYPGDAGDYQGHLTAIDLGTGTQHVFNAACSDQTVHFVELADPDCAQRRSAIWGRPGAVYDADNDAVLIATGNGTFDVSSGGHDWGDSVIALRPDASSNAGAPAGSYTPAEFQALQDNDADLGSTAPAILPLHDRSSKIAHLAVQGGKDGTLRLLDRDALSGAGAHVGGELQAIAVPQGGGVLAQPAVWVDEAGDGATWVFVANGSGIAGLQVVVDTSGTPSLVSRWTQTTPATSPVVANGVLYFAGSKGVFALDAKTGTSLWSDATIGAIHWQSPIVVDGRLVVADDAGQLSVYIATGLPDQIFKNGWE